MARASAMGFSFGTTWTSLDGRQWSKMKEEPQFNRAAIHLAIVRSGTNQVCLTGAARP